MIQISTTSRCGIAIAMSIALIALLLVAHATAGGLLAEGRRLAGHSGPSRQAR